MNAKIIPKNELKKCVNCLSYEICFLLHLKINLGFCSV